jgi:hypothetical protein
MALPAIYLVIAGVFEFVFGVAITAVIRRYALLFLAPLAAEALKTIIKEIEGAIIEWIRENGPQMVAQGIEAELGIDLRGDYSPEGFTDAINRKFGTEFRNLFDKDMVREDATGELVKKVNELLPPGYAIDSLDPERVKDELQAALTADIETAMSQGAGHLFNADIAQSVSRTIAAKIPEGFGPNPPKRPRMDRRSVLRRAYRKRWNEKYPSYRNIPI